MNNLCDDVLIHVSTWCDFITLIQLMRTQKQLSHLFRHDYVWRHQVQTDFRDILNQETSYYLSYQFLFKRANFLNLIQPLNLARFQPVLTLLELNETINRYWLKAVKTNGLL